MVQDFVQGLKSVRNPSSNSFKAMNTDIWRKLWAFLNQPLFEQNSAKVQRLERCWNALYIQDAEPEPDLQLLERCWHMSCQEVQLDLQLLERCWRKSCIQSKDDR
jgi:hypothetical protein